MRFATFVLGFFQTFHIHMRIRRLNHSSVSRQRRMAVFDLRLGDHASISSITKNNNKYSNIQLFKFFNPTVGRFLFLQLADFHSYSWLFFIPSVGYLVLYCCKVFLTHVSFLRAKSTQSVRICPARCIILHSIRKVLIPCLLQMPLRRRTGK